MSNSNADKVEYLKGVIYDLGLDYADTAKLCGVTKSTLYRWLNGTAPIHDGAMLLLEILSLDEIFFHPHVNELIKTTIGKGKENASNI